MSKQKIVNELTREQQMRKKVWKINGGFFVNRDHQTQYDSMQMALEIIQAMTEKEVATRLLDIEIKKRESPRLF